MVQTSSWRDMPSTLCILSSCLSGYEAERYCSLLSLQAPQQDFILYCPKALSLAQIADEERGCVWHGGFSAKPHLATQGSADKDDKGAECIPGHRLPPTSLTQKYWRGSLIFADKLLYFEREPLPAFWGVSGQVKEEQQRQEGTARLHLNVGWKQPGPPIPVQQLRHFTEVIKEMSLITRGQHLITFAALYPEKKPTPTTAGLAGELLPCTVLPGSGLWMQKNSLCHPETRTQGQTH